MPFYKDYIYWILLIPVLILSVYAQIKVSSSFNKYSGVRNRRGVTGAQAAYAVLRAHGVHDVAIRPCSGKLTDHYDPRDNTIYLSQPVYNAATVAAVGLPPMRRAMPCSTLWATARCGCAPPSFP